ncbi:hypothetical protein BAUCODRAFT_443346 [Baudoinia panamericana UAMH 10762]|uniref:SUZ domain-containing protein n=1 Tax=Baudoinia panamericana (strain UAMH 10762) TaxID=717646 RepID=M2MZX7_BAUPA|nr:uncharacterized protein BAUCODRAFT_443346 [Baudoinia panamericana UAMH 10762]EMC97198.1 hypothetical protein BAUCODRAFT_443346 [Baudoinia panamericana UAMH 10762]
MVLIPSLVSRRRHGKAPVVFLYPRLAPSSMPTSPTQHIHLRKQKSTSCNVRGSLKCRLTTPKLLCRLRTPPQLSISSGSAKPPSLDGKSIVSGTTFALDEKESLRPDDSASLKAIEDEDAFSPPVSTMSRPDNATSEGVRAFSDQLREISAMEPSGHSLSTQTFTATASLPARTLYDPQQPSGAGPQNAAMLTSRATDFAIDFPPDPKLLEALESHRDRVVVVKLETDIRDFINDPKEGMIDLPQFNAYHRMLAHKAAEYYMLGHTVDENACGVRLYKTVQTCLRPQLTGLATPSTAASTPPPNAPAMTILRRGLKAPAIVNGSNVPSMSNSEDGEDGPDDAKANRKQLTLKEREARYEAARLRIMGESKPSGYPEEAKPKDISRSSSITGKKTRNKKRADSDDGFEARSAYSAYFTPSFGTGTFAPGTYGASGYMDAGNGNVMPGSMQSQEPSSAFQPYFAQVSMPWSGVGPHQSPRVPQIGYDLSGEFQRAVSVQGAGMQQTPGMQSSFAPGYQQSFYGGQQPWAQQHYLTPQLGMHINNGFHGGSGGRPTSASSHAQNGQPYQYGQLPSQAFPGRPPSKLEHPLPGSYKGKHFNPQSQTFVPGQQSTPSVASFSPQAATAGAAPFGVSPQAPSAQPQHSTYNLPDRQPTVPALSPTPIHPMMHPLPQPVFPKQVSPNQPLPPRSLQSRHLPKN